MAALIGTLLMLASAPACFAASGSGDIAQEVTSSTVSAGAPPAAASGPDQPLDLAAFRGKVIYLDFWASWCAPCRESFPWMNGIQRQLGPEGLVVIAVDVDRERADGEHFIRELSPQFRIVFDSRGVLPEKFGVQGMPTSFLIDRQGRIRVEHQGFRLQDRDALAQQIRSLLAAQ